MTIGFGKADQATTPPDFNIVRCETQNVGWTFLPDKPATGKNTRPAAGWRLGEPPIWFCWTLYGSL